MRITQREANRKAVEFAADILEREDFNYIFGDEFGASELEAEVRHNEAVMDRAKRNVAARIRRMAPPNARVVRCEPRER